MYKNVLLLGAAVGALSAASAGAAVAQTAAAPIILEEINVEGQATGKKSKPAAVATQEETVLTTRATREDLDARQVTDVRDINRITPGVSFSETSRSFNVRGLERERVLTTIDGVPLLWLDDATRGVIGGSAGFDFDSISEIDIVKGSDSSVFGGGAMGGVVALRTLDPEELIDPDKGWGAMTRTGYDSRDNSWRADQAVAAKVGNTFVLVRGGYRNGEEMENQGSLDILGANRTKKNPSDYDQYNVMAKLHHYVDGGHRFAITGEVFERDESINVLSTGDEVFNPGPPASTYIAGTVRNDELVRRERLSASYKYDGGGFFDAAESTLYWQKQELGTDTYGVRWPGNAVPGPMTRENTRDAEIYGINGAALKIFDTGDIQHRVSFGGDIHGSIHTQYTGGSDACIDGTLTPPLPSSCASLHTNQADMPKVDGVTFGAFIQDEIGFADGAIRLTPGLRFDWYDYTPKLTDEFARNPAYASLGLPDGSSDSKLSPKLRLEGDVSSNVTLFAQWAQSFRAPSPTELYLTFGRAPFTGGYLVQGNEDLVPETSNGFEVGAKVGDDRAGGGINLFYNRYKNFIDTVNGSAVDFGYLPGEYIFVQSYRNLANVQIYGAELSGHYKHSSGWHGWGQVGVYVGEDMDTDVGLNSIPGARIMLGTGYAAEQWGADVIFTGVAKRTFNGTGPAAPSPGSELENAHSETPAYALVDLTAWWSPAQVEGLTLRAGVYNIFDETYYDDTLDIGTSVAKEYRTKPGRNFRVSASYKF